MGKEIRIPYTDIISYYGYIKPGTAPDETRGGKNYYYLYLWIPAVAPESVQVRTTGGGGGPLGWIGPVSCGIGGGGMKAPGQLSVAVASNSVPTVV